MWIRTTVRSELCTTVISLCSYAFVPTEHDLYQVVPNMLDYSNLKSNHKRHDEENETEVVFRLRRVITEVELCVFETQHTSKVPDRVLSYSIWYCV